MGQTDLAIRMLADLLQAQLVPALLASDEVHVIGTEQTELKIIERRTDNVVRARINGVETIVNVEFQASHDAAVPTRMLAYHALLRQRYDPLPVRTIVVYLMHEPPAGGEVPRGLYRRPGDDQLEFIYDVFCVWDRPITLEDVRRTPSLAPLAPLTPGIAAADLPVLQALLEREVHPARLSGELQALTVVLASRRFSLDLLQSFLRSKAMLESSPGYQYFLSQGEALGESRALVRATIRLLEHHLGALPVGLEEHLAGLELPVLKDLFDQVVEDEDDEKALRQLVDDTLCGD